MPHRACFCYLFCKTIGSTCIDRGSLFLSHPSLPNNDDKSQNMGYQRELVLLLCEYIIVFTLFQLDFSPGSFVSQCKRCVQQKFQPSHPLLDVRALVAGLLVSYPYVFVRWVVMDDDGAFFYTIVITIATVVPAFSTVCSPCFNCGVNAAVFFW